MKKNRINRFIFALEGGDYAEALEILAGMKALLHSEDEVISHLLIVRTLEVLKEYTERMKLLQDDAPFDDIKLSYLNENYSEARNRVNDLEEHGFLKPLLSGLDGALYRNSEMRRDIEDDVAMRRKVRELSERAEQLEGRGEYAKAAATYEDLLIFQLPSYDREVLLKRIQRLWLAVELQKLKREQNTRAIKYLESARILNREGNEEEALDYYQMLLMECPHSDFVEDAVKEIMRIAPGLRSSA
jgi:tetratricopeptide (TPR) repeat protein